MDSGSWRDSITKTISELKCRKDGRVVSRNKFRSLKTKKLTSESPLLCQKVAGLISPGINSSPICTSGPLLCRTAIVFRGEPSVAGNLTVSTTACREKISNCWLSSVCLLFCVLDSASKQPKRRKVRDNIPAILLISHGRAIQQTRVSSF